MKEKHPDYELKYINRGYYVYRAVGEWDKEKKKSVKKTVYVGSISVEGVFKPKKEMPFYESNSEVFEYGNSMLAMNFLEDCKGLKTRYIKEILAMGILKALDPCPVRLMKSKWEKLYVSNLISVDLSPGRVSHVLKEVGKDVSAWYDLFSELTPAGDLLLYDLTCIISYSKNIKLAEKGYNKDHVYDDQIGVVMAFSTSDSLPVGIEVFPGSLRDISTIKDFIKRLRRTDIGFIMDTGFYSEPLLKEFRENGIKYIVPLRRNTTMIEQTSFNEFFEYRERGIQAMKQKKDDEYLYIFRDPLLRGEEESTLIKRLHRKEITPEKYDEKQKRAGIIGIISSMNEKPEKIYDLYKGREDVEQAFDTMKNTLETDKTYMHSPEAVRGYMLLTFLALRIHYKILKRLKQEQISKKTSIEETLYELSKIEIIKEKTGKQYLAKIPKKAQTLKTIFPEINNMG